MQEDPDRVMYDLKTFLGMDPTLPVVASLTNVNSRHNKGGYPMTLQEYQKMVELVRPSAEAVAKMLGEKGLHDEERWLGRWTEVWERMAKESCDVKGRCEIDSN